MRRCSRSTRSPTSYSTSKNILFQFNSSSQCMSQCPTMSGQGSCWALPSSLAVMLCVATAIGHH
uniref:Uncharacterized protein n=1 Tax=Triticum urartu TaxID=4572 RepID=A0A8R7P0V5_TRIUA